MSITPLQQRIPPTNADKAIFASDKFSKVSKDLFRSGMALMSGACTIITSKHQGNRAGLTATAVCSVSAEPPRLLVCINRNVWAYQVISASLHLGVNVLNAQQENLARRFAGMQEGVIGSDRFLEGNWFDSPNGVPILRDALSGFECRVIDEAISGTHSVFMCEVIDISKSEKDASALVYFNRRFVAIN